MADAHSATHSGPAVGKPLYFIPAPSQWPIVGSIAMAFTMFGAAMVVNHNSIGWIPLGIGLATLIYMFIGWFAIVSRESEGGDYNRKVDVSFRWGMSWFIFSEVMFFASFFGALFYARLISAPLLGDFDHKLLWPDFVTTWPHGGPAGTIEPFTTIGPFWLPTINTALLLSSGVTITISHHALRANHRARAILWLAITIVLGVTFLGVQAYEYGHAYSDLNLKLSSGIFGSTFFMLTGFHGFHVFLGAAMLSVILLRLIRGHFTPEQHFGFEGAAWYWHFVDVVWIGLYICVYWL
ncbi:MAG: cytochrome c oxidase subunit 3 [Burkholderiaceae bacterium]